MSMPVRFWMTFWAPSCQIGQPRHTCGLDFSALKGDLDSAAALEFQAVTEADGGHNGLVGGQARQAGQVVARVELHHIVQSGHGSGDHLIHLQSSDAVLVSRTVALCVHISQLVRPGHSAP